jgi:uncharacterized protein YegP (UPF0339 family)
MTPSSNQLHATRLASAVILAITSYGCGGTNGYTSGVDSTNTNTTGSATTATAAASVAAVSTLDAKATSWTQTINTSASAVTPATQNATQPATSTPSTTQSTATEPPLAAPNTSQIGPLIQASNIVYQGAFALPTGGSSTPYSQAQLGSSRFGYGAEAMSAYRDSTTGKLSIFISGFGQGQVAQVEVPSQFLKSLPFTYTALPTAPLLQKFRDITNGDITSQTSTLGFDSNGASSRGFLASNGRLIFSAVNWYSYRQSASHGIASIDFTSNQNWSGFFRPSTSVVPIRAIAGSMAITPPSLQAALGGKALTGGSSVSVISTASYGPALSSFDPESIGVVSEFQTNPLLYYPGNHPVCGFPGCDNTNNAIFNWGSVIRGFAVIPGADSILFVGTHGVGGYWYGGMTGPNGEQELPGNMWQGPHSTAYEYRVWAYRVSDLALVKAGKAKPWDIKPYAIIKLPELSAEDPLGRIASSTFDQDSGLLFVATGFREEAKIYVYKIISR